jgi:hypothetical protein
MESHFKGDSPSGSCKDTSMLTENSFQELHSHTPHILILSKGSTKHSSQQLLLKVGTNL